MSDIDADHQKYREYISVVIGITIPLSFGILASQFSSPLSIVKDGAIIGKVFWFISIVSTFTSVILGLITLSLLALGYLFQARQAKTIADKIFGKTDILSFVATIFFILGIFIGFVIFATDYWIN